MADSVRVLLVDDEEDFLESVGFWLTSKGYHVTKAHDGEAALAILKEGRHDVVFLDVMMPNLDGIETLRRLRAFNKTIPVILVTASNLTDENKYAGAKALGLSGLFPKGSSLTQLTQALEVALRALRKSAAATAVPPSSTSPAAPAAPHQGPLASALEALRKMWGPPRPPAPRE